MTASFYGGELDGQVFDDPATVKRYARGAQRESSLTLTVKPTILMVYSGLALAPGLPTVMPYLLSCSSLVISGMVLGLSSETYLLELSRARGRS